MNKRQFKKRIKQISKRPEQIAARDMLEKALRANLNEHVGMKPENFFAPMGLTRFTKLPNGSMKVELT